jgi:tetratricopeptide (TPR) repeat protein
LATDLNEARELAESGKYPDAWRILSPHLSEEPNDPKGLLLASFMLEKQGNPALAYQICKQITTAHPSNPVGWINLGKCCDTLWRMAEAEACYARALTQLKAGDDDTRLTIYTNLAAVHLQMGDFDKARQFSEKALKIDPEHLKSRHNMGLCLLASGEWKEGWRLYEASVGSPQRIAWNYGGEPTWQGEPGGSVVIFGEQGIGDEVCAASMIPDAIKRAGKVIIDCDARLANLFQRSFPEAKVYGTRSAKVLNWAEEDQKVDYSIAAMQVGALFRQKAEDFPGTPFLKADPERVLMWKALWKDKGKPVIGIAWTGGLKETAAMYRRWSHEEMAQIMRTIPAKWVSLQYKDAAQEITEFRAKYPDIDLVQYPQATLARDYDETAALFASLDAVVAMQSTAVHVAGALGVPCAAGIPKTSQWRYGASGDSLPWYSCVKLFRQKKLGQWELDGIKQWLRQSLFS